MVVAQKHFRFKKECSDDIKPLPNTTWQLLFDIRDLVVEFFLSNELLLLSVPLCHSTFTILIKKWQSWEWSFARFRKIGKVLWLRRSSGKAIPNTNHLKQHLELIIEGFCFSLIFLGFSLFKSLLFLFRREIIFDCTVKKEWVLVQHHYFLCQL